MKFIVSTEKKKKDEEGK